MNTVEEPLCLQDAPFLRHHLSSETGLPSWTFDIGHLVQRFGQRPPMDVLAEVRHGSGRTNAGYPVLIVLGTLIAELQLSCCQYSSPFASLLNSGYITAAAETTGPRTLAVLATLVTRRAPPAPVFPCRRDLIMAWQVLQWLDSQIHL